MATGESIEIDVDGTLVRVSNPDKVFFTGIGATKLDLVSYYRSIAAPLMRTVQGRPITMERYPDGASGKSFYQKRVPTGPDWLVTTEVATVNGTPSAALVLADMAHVVYAVNLGCLGFHPWPFKAADPLYTDELRIDLDPSPGVTFAMVREAALATRELLREIGVTGYVKTTGSRGLHVYVRVLEQVDSYAVRAAAVAFARGARSPSVRRLQPERAAQNRVRCLGRATARRRTGIDTGVVGRVAHRRS